jgi:hypothetical protein
MIGTIVRRNTLNNCGRFAQYGELARMELKYIKLPRNNQTITYLNCLIVST